MSCTDNGTCKKFIMNIEDDTRYFTTCRSNSDRHCFFSAFYAHDIPLSRYAGLVKHIHVQYSALLWVNSAQTHAWDKKITTILSSSPAANITELLAPLFDITIFIFFFQLLFLSIDCSVAIRHHIAQRLDLSALHLGFLPRMCITFFFCTLHAGAWPCRGRLCFMSEKADKRARRLQGHAQGNWRQCNAVPAERGKM